MTPVQILRVGFGDEAIHVPLFRLPYAGSPDSAARPGGLFTTREGEFGVVLDANTPIEDAQRILAEELRDHGAFLAAALQRAVEQQKQRKDTDNDSDLRGTAKDGAADTAKDDENDAFVGTAR